MNNQEVEVPTCLKIAVTFDLDHDLSTVTQSPEESRNRLEWRGLDIGIGLIEEELRVFKDSFNGQIKFTWFVRADNQLEHIYGSPYYLFDYLDRTITCLEDAGDEIAWHPHIYKLHKGTWFLNKDTWSQRENLIRTYELISKKRKFYSVRLGETYCTNTIMETLAELGLKVDSSALPGRKRVDDLKTFDWCGTPQLPYYPSVKDYRIPALPCTKILEVPISMLNIKTNYDERALARYLNIAFHTDLIEPSLEDLIQHATYIVTISHPSEFMPDYKNGLLSGSIISGKSNLQLILETCRKLSKPYKFVTIKEFEENEVNHAF